MASPRSSTEDLGAYFTPSDRDRIEVRRQRGDSNRLGFARDSCAPSAIWGSCPTHCASHPRLSSPISPYNWGPLPNLWQHMATARRQGPTTSRRSSPTWGSERPGLRTFETSCAWPVPAWSLQHDRLTFLLQLACEHLRTDKVVRPGPTSLERLVAAAQQEAQRETFRLLGPLLTGTGRTRLDCLLVPDPVRGGTPARLAPPCCLIQLAEGRPGVHREDRLPGGRPASTVVARRPEPQPPQAARPGRPAGQRAGPATDA